MRLHFYGTGASEGFPAVFCECEHCRKARKLGGKNLRTRSSCGVNEDLLIDFSADSFAHMLYGGLDISTIKHMIITHSHQDHFYPNDLRNIAPPFAFYERSRTLDICGNSTVINRLQQDIHSENNCHLFPKVLKRGEKYQLGNYTVTPVAACHDPKEECFLYLIQWRNQTLFYGHDSAMYNEETWAILKQHTLDCVVMDCTCGLGPSVFQTHMSMVDNVKIRTRMIKERIATDKTIFIATHFAHTFAPFHEPFTDTLSQNGIVAAYDGLQVDF